MYTLKKVPEDFLVKELKELKDTGGQYHYYLLRKRDRNTHDVLQILSYVLHIPLKHIGFAGTKDKHAVTEQYISIKGIGKERVERLDLDGVTLEHMGSGPERINLGELKGNSFEIVVRDIDQTTVDRVRAMGRTLKVPNYFGEQRFGTINVDVGLAILKKDFRHACELVISSGGSASERVTKSLKKQPTDYVGALKTIPTRLLKMYVHAYQSKLWNILVEMLIKKGCCPEIVPIVGFGINMDNDIKIHYAALLAEDGLTERDFIIRPIPEATSEGTMRNSMLIINDFQVLAAGDDELGDKSKIKIGFTLGKGSYATVVIDHIFG